MKVVHLGLRGAVVPVAALLAALSSTVLYLELRAVEGEAPIPALAAAFG